MTHFPLLAIAAFSLVLAACENPPKAPPASQNRQLELKLASGPHNCEHKVRIQVEREIRDRVNQRITIGWNGNRYRLERDPSYSGLPRFEDSASGLVWIDLPWKGLLLDGKTNKPLVNECRPA
jgi:hypothetical protein